jgi:uncharacterized membrane protein
MSDSKTPQAVPVSSATQKESPKTVAEVIQEKAPEILKNLSGETKGALARVTIEETRISMRSAPLPDPSELSAYNQVIPNGADRILKMAEDQSAHRIDIEKTVVKSQQVQAFCGQLFALIIGITGLSLATYAAVQGHPGFGGAIGGATLVSLVSSFLYTRHAQKKELEIKRDQMNAIQQQIQNRKGNKRNR